MKVYSIILLAVAVLFIAVGISMYRGNAGWVTDERLAEVQVRDLKRYARAFGKVMLAIAVTLFASGFLGFLGTDAVILGASLFVLVGGLVVSIWALVTVQRHFNGGLF